MTTRFRPRSRQPPFAAAAALSLLLAAGLVGCTSSGDGGLSVVDDFIRQGPTWIPDPLPAPGQPHVHLVNSQSTRERICLTVRAEFVLDLFAVAFSLSYDSSRLGLASWSDGGFLGSGGSILPPQVRDWPSLNRIDVGMTRNGAVTSAGVSGSGALLTLCFDLKATTPGSPIVFTGNVAGLGPNEEVVIPAAAFIGGTIRIE